MQRISIKYQKGFTLIELLVVIAIIGVLASVVLASLNSARTKGQIAAIKSNLKNIIPQAELTYDGPGNYSAVCADTKVASMLTAITNGSTYTSCYSYNNAGLSDVYLRYGASAIIGTSTPIQAYSVSGTGVTTWDAADLTAANLPGGATKNFADANTACANIGGRLPTIEEFKALSDAAYTASDNVSHIPSSFSSSTYWSGTTAPSDDSRAYRLRLIESMYGILRDVKTAFSTVRCVR